MLSFKEFISHLLFVESMTQTQGKVNYDKASKDFNPLDDEMRILMNLSTDKGKLVWPTSETKPRSFVFKFNENPQYSEVFLKQMDNIVKHYDMKQGKAPGAKISFKQTKTKNDSSKRDEYVLTYTDNDTPKPVTYKFKSSSGRSGSNGGNKGNNFETEFAHSIREFINNQPLPKHRDTILELESLIQKYHKNFSLKNSLKEDKNQGVSVDGGKNQKRPLTFTSKGVEISGGITNIGSTVTDITLLGKNSSENVYLSLKHGSPCVLINLGVGAFFNQAEMKSGKITNKIGKYFLETFNIDNEMFCEVFNSTAEKRDRKIHIPTELVKVDSSHTSNMIQHFLSSVIGYGFIWVHEINGKIHLIDVMTPEKNKKVVGRVESCYIRYCRPGAKVVTFVINTSTMKIDMVIRNNSGGVYPAVVNLNYSFKQH